MRHERHGYSVLLVKGLNEAKESVFLHFCISVFLLFLSKVVKNFLFGGGSAFIDEKKLTGRFFPRIGKVVVVRVVGEMRERSEIMFCFVNCIDHKRRR